MVEGLPSVCEALDLEAKYLEVKFQNKKRHF